MACSNAVEHLNGDDETAATGMDMVGAALKRGQLTDAVRHLLTEAGHPLTTNDIVEKLKQLGWVPMDEHLDPAQLRVSTRLANRLVEQEFAEQTNEGSPTRKRESLGADKALRLISSLKETDEKTRSRRQDAPEGKRHGTGTPRKTLSVR